MPIKKQKLIFLASIVHDIGALSTRERLDLIEEENIDIDMNNHGFVGARLLGNFKPLHDIVKIVKYHHVNWNYGEGKTYKEDAVPLESHIIHVADRVCAKIKSETNILSQVDRILEDVSKSSGSKFAPSLVDALISLKKYNYIWLDLMSDTLINKIDINLSDLIELEIDDIIDLAKMFSHIVDFRSSFTARHSAGVASVAHALSKLMCFSPFESKMMLVAGYLHDLGKLTISDTILEKPGKLSDDEYHIIRSHTYYTYQLLDSIPKLREINKWASFHHERMDGEGYPFHIKGEDLPLGSRIMAVADVFTAIKEDRPYRAEVSDEKAMSILRDMAESGGLDSNVVEIISENFNDINNIRNDAQKNATIKYNNFFSSPSSI